jgi:hypothetical protein
MEATFHKCAFMEVHFRKCTFIEVGFRISAYTKVRIYRHMHPLLWENREKHVFICRKHTFMEARICRSMCLLAYTNMGGGSNVQLVPGEKIQLISKSKMGAERRARPLKMSAHGVKCYIVWLSEPSENRRESEKEPMGAWMRGGCGMDADGFMDTQR